MLTIDPQAADCDPETGQPWPRRFDTKGSARYLRIEHGLPAEDKTLANQRVKGDGPKWQYFGQKPLAERTELDRYAIEDALKAESPLRRRARERAERRRLRALAQESAAQT